MEVDLRAHCRACLLHDKCMLPLFDEYENGFSLAMILQTVLHVEVEINGSLPQFLCEDCCNVLTQFYNFTVTYEESEKQLKSILKAAQGQSVSSEDAEVVSALSYINSDVESLKSSDPEDSLSDEKLHTDVEHKEEEEDPKNLSCEEDVKETDSSQLRKGYETIKKFQCDLCSDEHLYEISFQQHMRSKHNLDLTDVEAYASVVQLPVRQQPADSNNCVNFEEEILKIYECTQCKRKFSTERQLKHHTTIHRGNRRYICEICGSGFLRKSYLNDHRESHSNEKKYLCKFCGKAFKRRTVLRAHKRVHTHPNHYVCEVCGRAFTNSSTLKTHTLLLHIKSRDFKCIICNQTFPLKSTLTKHLIRHKKRETGEKGFNCTECNMQYRDKSSLKRHMEIKHEGEPKMLFCSFCPKKYTSKNNLTKHVNKHHIKTELKLEEDVIDIFDNEVVI